MSIRVKADTFYTLDNLILQEVQDNPYLIKTNTFLLYGKTHGLDRDILLKNFNANNSEEGDQCFTCILIKKGGGLKWIVNTLKFEIE